MRRQEDRIGAGAESPGSPYGSRASLAALLLASCVRPIKSTLARAPYAWRRWPSCGFAPSRTATCTAGSAARRWRPIRPHATPSSKSSDRASAADTRSKDAADREWSAKFPPEAPTEIAASRILWGIGYHQPPIYYLAELERRQGDVAESAAAGAVPREEAGPARSRRQGRPGRTTRTPSSARREMNGLLVLQAMLGNSDLKDEQNAALQAEASRSKARSSGTSRAISARRSAAPASSMRRAATSTVFEQTPFITGVADGTRAVRLSRPPPRALREHHAGGRPLDLRATLQPHRRSSGTTRSAPAGLPKTSRRSLHPPDEAEDRRRPRAEGLMRYLRFTPRLVSAVLVAPGADARSAPGPAAKAVERDRPQAFKQLDRGRRGTRSTRCTRSTPR